MPRIALKEQESDATLTVAELEALVGRDPACGFVIEGPKAKVVSGRHARIFFQDGGWWIQDMSRNGTILDDERLQPGQRHALRVGQLIGLGESGPRLRVTALESRSVSDTMIESSEAAPKVTTAPRQRPVVPGAPPAPAESTTAMRKSEALRAGVKFEEPTEPASMASDWLVHIVLRATHSDQRFEARHTVVKVGRSPECHIRIPAEQGASVSRIHCELAVATAGVVIRDAASRNGTFVNGNRIQGAQPLAMGDRIMLGSGGMTLEVADLHIVKGEPSEPAAGAGGIGGGATPADPVAAREGRIGPMAEPPTAPAPGSEGTRAAHAVMHGTRLSPRDAPLQRAGLMEDVMDGLPKSSARRARTLIWVGLGILIIAAAVMLGRMSAN